MIPTLNTGSLGIFAALIGLAVLGILAGICLLAWNNYNCRYLLYFSCVILFFLGIISFLLAIGVSTIIPGVYFTCDAMTFALSSATNFNGNNYII